MNPDKAHYDIQNDLYEARTFTPVPIDVALTRRDADWIRQVCGDSPHMQADIMNDAVHCGTFRTIAMNHGQEVIGLDRQSNIVELADLPRLRALPGSTESWRVALSLENWSRIEWMRRHGDSYAITMFKGLHTLGSLAAARATTLAVRSNRMSGLSVRFPLIAELV